MAPDERRISVRDGLQETLHRFRRDQRGVFAVWFAVMAIPMMLMAGAGLDMMRAVQLRSELQAAADSAALAGASVYVSSTASTTAQAVANRFMANAVARMPYASSITYTSTPSSSSAAVYSVAVTAQASVPNSIMAILKSATDVGVTAVARSAGYKLAFSLSSFASNAADADSIYWYVVPSDNGVPSESALNLLFSNTGGNTSKDIAAIVGTGQKIGFALKNVTGGISGYGKNGYGGAQGSTHMFYSHLSPPSSVAYPSVLSLFNCSLQTTVGKSTSVNSGCQLSLGAVANGTINCSQSAGKTINYYWNDMGGTSDDRDYNDAVFNVTCPSSTSSSSGSQSSSSVVLTK
jgi:Flp pilus assembly protein TadG